MHKFFKHSLEEFLELGVDEIDMENGNTLKSGKYNGKYHTNSRHRLNRRKNYHQNVIIYSNNKCTRGKKTSNVRFNGLNKTYPIQQAKLLGNFARSRIMP